MMPRVTSIQHINLLRDFIIIPSCFAINTINLPNFICYLYDVPMGFIHPPLIWGGVLLYLRSPKGSRYLILDDLLIGSEKVDSYKSVDNTCHYNWPSSISLRLLNNQHFHGILNINLSYFLALCHTIWSHSSSLWVAIPSIVENIDANLSKVCKLKWCRDFNSTYQMTKGVHNILSPKRNDTK